MRALRAVAEREDESHLTRALATLHERRAHRAGERVDDEEQSLGILEPVLYPLERRVRQRSRQRLEQPAIVLGARALPEPDTFDAEAHFDRLGIERTERTAGFDA